MALAVAFAMVVPAQTYLQRCNNLFSGWRFVIHMSKVVNLSTYHLPTKLNPFDPKCVRFSRG